MAAKILQANLNHACQAQNMFAHYMAEHGCAIGIIAEPYRVPTGNSNWASDDQRTVAITWRTTQDFPPCNKIQSKKGILMVDWGKYTIISVYVSPNDRLSDFEKWLEEITDCLKKRPARPTIIAGDFNAKSEMWGARLTNTRGRTTERWAAQNGLVLVNVGSTSTCVRYQGESVIDLTWATPRAAKDISNWRVAEEMEIISDHKIIEMHVSIFPPAMIRRMKERRIKEPRWAIKKMDEDHLAAVINAATWITEWESKTELQDRVEWLQSTLKRACDAAMPRTRPNNRTPTYWWTEDIAQLRKVVIRTNRLLSRARRKRNEQRISQAWEARKIARQEMATAVRKAKASAWEEALADLDRDPWGRPYRAVMNKFRPRIPPITRTMEPDLRERVLSTLFPKEEEKDPHFPHREIEGEEEWDENGGDTMRGGDGGKENWNPESARP